MLHVGLVRASVMGRGAVGVSVGGEAKMSLSTTSN
jgi:hypothetical protein